MKTSLQFAKDSGVQRGSMLLELLIAMVVLVFGMGGLLALLLTSIYTNTNTRNDTTSTMLAEHVLEQITSQPANSNALLSLTDCAGNAWNIDPTGAVVGSGNSGSYGGDGATLTSAGVVDWTQNYATVPVGYAMQYVSCGTGGRQTVYDVRWNVATISAYSRMVFVSARPSGSLTTGGLRFVMPVNLRTIGGM